MFSCGSGLKDPALSQLCLWALVGWGSILAWKLPHEEGEAKKKKKKKKREKEKGIEIYF